MFGVVTSARLLCLASLLFLATACTDEEATAPDVTVTAETADAVGARQAAYDIEAQLGIASPEIAYWLRQQSWVHDGDEKSLRAVAAIVSAQYHSTPARQEERRADVLKLLQALDEGDWYIGNLWPGEKLSVAAIFDVYIKWATSIQTSGTSRRSVDTLPDYPWLELLSRSLRDKLFTPYKTRDGRDIQIVGLSLGSYDDSRLAIVYTLVSLEQLETLLGPYEALRSRSRGRRTHARGDFRLWYGAIHAPADPLPV